MPIKPIIKSCKIFICGEAPGKDEEFLGTPFIGMSGQELKKMLTEAGIDYNFCSVSNVFLERPADNKIENFCVNKKEAGYNYPPPLSMGKYFRPELLSNRQRLYEEIKNSGASLVLALGNTACWALLDKTGINSLRGAAFKSPHVDAIIFPCFHPAAVLRNWEIRHTTVVDFAKALKISQSNSLAYDEVEVLMEPQLQDLEAFYQKACLAPAIAWDIETSPARGQILCIGFGINGTSIVVPFVDKRKEGFSYWDSIEEEVLAWKFVRDILSLPCPKITQNGLYDIPWLWKKLGIFPNGSCEDTMLLHHSMFPEMQKSLDFFGSVYCNLPAWKGMHRRGEFNKQED